MSTALEILDHHFVAICVAYVLVCVPVAMWLGGYLKSLDIGS